MTRTWGLFAWVREKRAEEPVVVPWKPVDFEILDVWSGPLFTPGAPAARGAEVSAADRWGEEGAARVLVSDEKPFLDLPAVERGWELSAELNRSLGVRPAPDAPDAPPFNPNGLPIWYPPFSPNMDLIGYRDGYSRGC